MVTFLTILIVIACILLIMVVLVQNPKGGGLSATFGGSSSQYFGVQRTTDFLEKATWALAIAVFIISLGMNMFIPRSQNPEDSLNTTSETAQPALPNPQSNPPDLPITPSPDNNPGQGQ